MLLVAGLSIGYGHAEANISVMTLPYSGWEVEFPFDDNGTGTIKIQPNTKQGRQIAASVAFYSFEFCKNWFGKVHPLGSLYISKARRTNPQEFAVLQRSIQKAVQKVGLRKNRETCIMLTGPYQAGGDVSLLMPWGDEGFYPEQDQ